MSELFISGEPIALVGRRVMQTLLHEAAHGLADVRGIQDTGNKHRFHNQRFVRLARELGLEPPATKDDVLGWSECRITDATTERYKDAIAVIDAERLPYRRSAWVAYLRKWGDGQDGGQASDPGGDQHAHAHSDRSNNPRSEIGSLDYPRLLQLPLDPRTSVNTITRIDRNVITPPGPADRPANDRFRDG
ncbi:hypothetical protein ACFFV7_46180 [Nonomuraea spiralis]|uniref:Uncharacterized protein n=1 Tax=Nonomuraea spiralis TaxID=46182 RepID=A0ABV5IVP1_9ACTN|nr:hypothetical protein [Nonomuraea spiralis]GGS84005.1 hypothetical protein GCM10010176_029560 [Nonomuraea spiralis]